MVASQQRLGALLVDMGFIDDAQLASALEEQQRTDKRLGKILVEMSVLSEDRLVHALSRQLGIEACDPIMTRVHERVLALVPPDLAFRHRVLPVARQREADRRDVVYVATADPLDDEALQAVADALGDQARVQWMLAGETEMELALARHYGRPVPDGTKVITGVPVAGPPRSPPDPDDAMSVLASTDDVLAALAVPGEGATTQPDQPLPPTAAANGAGGGSESIEIRPPGTPPDSGELPLSAMSDHSTEEILLAEEVVASEHGAALLAMPQLNDDAALADGPTMRGDVMSSPGSNLAHDQVPDYVDQVPLSLDLHSSGSIDLRPGVDVQHTASLDLATGSAQTGKSEDITHEVLDGLGEDNPVFAGGPVGAVEPSWGELVDRTDRGTVPELPSLGFDGAADDPALAGAMTELARSVESLPVADVSLVEARPAPELTVERVDHPAEPFPPLEGQPDIQDPEDEAQVDLDALVEKLIEPRAPLSTLPMPVSSQEAAASIQREIEFFVAGGTLDLSSQQRVLRAIAAVMMQQGLLDSTRIEAALQRSAGHSRREDRLTGTQSFRLRRPSDS